MVLVTVIIVLAVIFKMTRSVTAVGLAICALGALSAAGTISIPIPMAAARADISAELRANEQRALCNHAAMAAGMSDDDAAWSKAEAVCPVSTLAQSIEQ